MLIFDLHTIGNKLLTIRKRMGMTQAEVAEAADLSDRAYAVFFLLEEFTTKQALIIFFRLMSVLSRIKQKLRLRNG